jgi:hypothetical protein
MRLPGTKPSSRSLVPLLSTGLLCAFSGPRPSWLAPGEQLAFKPEAGSSLQKRFLSAMDFALDEMSMVVDGQDVGGMLGALEISGQQETKIEVTDVYDALGEGRPTKLARTFDGLGGIFNMSMSADMGGGEQEMKSTSQLEGETVVFTWNEEKGEYDVAFRDGEGDAELLADLKEDMDLRVFLPASEVAEEESWQVDLKELQALAMPGGDLRILPEDAELDAEQMEMFEEMFSGFGQDFADLLEGECNCTFRSVREEGDSRLAEIAIQIEIASTVDLTELLEEVIQKASEFAGEMPDLSIDTADLNLDYEGEGVLLWDLEAGHMYSLEINGDAEMALDFSISLEVEGEQHAMEATLELSGSVRQEVETGG